MSDIKFPAIKDGEGVWLSLSEMADLLGTTAPAPTPEPEPAVLPWERMAPNPSLVVGHTEIPPGQRYAYVKLATSHPPEATCFVSYGVRNVSGGGINTGDGSNQRKYYPAHVTVWRPGDDAEHWLTIDLQAPRSVGNAIELILKPKGFNSDSGVIRKISVVEGAVNELPAQMPKHRPPYRLDLSSAAPAADLDIGNMKWSDSGYDAAGKPCWRSRLAHGYTQYGNGEMGAYLNTDKFPDDAVHPQSIEILNGKPILRLHTKRLDKPVYTDATSAYQFQASMIQGQRLDEWCARRGIYRAQLQTPDRHGAWSAFWAIGRSENGIWPPEIDFFEHFNGAWGPWPTDGKSTSSAQHVGAHGSNSRKRVNGLTVDLEALGFGPTNLYTEAHDYACVIEDDYITHFIDGIETLQHRNMTDHQDGDTNWEWFPMLNVAVKPSSVNDPYDQGSGDMLVHGLQRYAAGSGYTMTPLAAAKPWPPQL